MYLIVEVDSVDDCYFGDLSAGEWVHALLHEVPVAKKVLHFLLQLALLQHLIAYLPQSLYDHQILATSPYQQLATFLAFVPGSPLLSCKLATCSQLQG